MGVKEGKGEDKQKKPKGDGGGLPTIMLKVDLHCEGCALKVKRSVKRLDGVESVSVDIAGNKLTVAGKVDPVLLRERVEEKTRKKVELVSLAGSTAKPKDGAEKPAAGGDTKKPAAAAAASAVDGGVLKEGKKAAEGKKSKAPHASTVVLKIRLHCEDCITRIRKSIYKIKGVDDVFVDASKDLVTIKGIMDPKVLPSILKDKLKRGVEIVPSKKDDGGGDKKVDGTSKKASDDGEKVKEGGDAGEKAKEGGDAGEKKKEGGGEEKKKEGGDAGERKKEGGGEDKKKEGGDNGGDKKEDEGEKKKEIDRDHNNVKNEADKVTPVVTMNKMEYYGSYGYPIEIAPSSYEYLVQMGSTSYEYGVEKTQAPHGYMYEMTHTPYGYGVNMTHAPQILSDENPNACSIM